MRFITFIILVFVLASCNNEQKRVIPTKQTFKKLNTSITGITFNNDIQETQTRNHFLWPSIYNGCGVGISDINNDGLLDVMFTRTFGKDELYLNKGNMKFENISAKAGIEGNPDHVSAGITFGDVNQDGYKDIYVSVFGSSENPEDKHNRLYINNGDLTFTERAAELGVQNGGFTIQSAFIDYDLDGDEDLYVLNQPSNVRAVKQRYADEGEAKFMNETTLDRLYRNDGGKFTDVSKEAGIEKFAFGLGIKVQDINMDGYPDIYIANDYDKPDFMYINDKKGGFVNTIDDAVNHISNFAMGVDISDINNDGLVDIGVLDMAGANHYRSKTNMPSMSPEQFYANVDNGLHYQYMHNTLQLNNGDNTFSDIAYLAGIAKTDWSWSLVMGDFDNDANKDIYITNGIKKDIRNSDYLLKLKERIGGSEDKYSASPLEILDLIPSTPMPNYFYHNDGSLHFTDRAAEWGLGDKGYSQGCAYGDLDNDGDLDLVVNNMSALASIYENQVGGANNYLRIKVVSDKNRSLLNTKAYVYTEDGKMQYADLAPVKGIMSYSEDVFHFGLSDAKVTKAELVWPDGKVTTLSQPKVNKQHTVTYEKSDKKAYDGYSNKSDETLLVKSNDIQYKHIENDYDDFATQLLLPYQPSKLGPFMSVADANGDGIEDVYVGGASGQAGGLYIGSSSGKFARVSNDGLSSDRDKEDMGSTWLDIDGDGDQDLYVASGGYEHKSSSAKLIDRLYINDGKGNLTKSASAIPAIKQSTMAVVSADFNGDGKDDVASFGRIVPGEYPKLPDSYLLINEGSKLKDKTGNLAPDMKSLGMVTDAIATDYDKDGDIDILVVGEWSKVRVLKNDGGKMTLTDVDGVEDSGLYTHINMADFDGDGDLDMIVGNIGKNIKWKASKEKPFRLYADDFDKNGGYDIVLANYADDQLVPVRGRECSSQQLPYITEEFETFEDFATAPLEKIYNLDKAQNLEATSLKSAVYINDGKGIFSKGKLPVEAQMAPINATVFADINKDGNMDMIAVGNQFSMEVETTRLDAGSGLVMLGDGSGNFKYVPSGKSAMSSRGNAKDMVMANGKLIVSNNDAPAESYTIK